MEALEGRKTAWIWFLAERTPCVCVCVRILTPLLTCPPFSVTHLWPFCRLFIDGDRIDAPSVKEHLLLDLGLEAEYRIQVLPYKSILSELKALCADLSPRDKVWVSDKASYAVSEAIPKVGGPTLACPNPASPSSAGIIQTCFWSRDCGI